MTGEAADDEATKLTGKVYFVSGDPQIWVGLKTLTWITKKKISQKTVDLLKEEKEEERSVT